MIEQAGPVQEFPRLVSLDGHPLDWPPPDINRDPSQRAAELERWAHKTATAIVFWILYLIGRTASAATAPVVAGLDIGKRAYRSATSVVFWAFYLGMFGVGLVVTARWLSATAAGWLL